MLDKTQPKFIENQSGKPCKNITGLVSGQLTALTPCSTPEGKDYDRNQWWLCSCTCGNEQPIKGRLLEQQVVKRCAKCRG